jgi:hypothetical protein
MPTNRSRIATQNVFVKVATKDFTASDVQKLFTRFKGPRIRDARNPKSTDYKVSIIYIYAYEYYKY